MSQDRPRPPSAKTCLQTGTRAGQGTPVGAAAAQPVPAAPYESGAGHCPLSAGGLSVMAGPHSPPEGGPEQQRVGLRGDHPVPCPPQCTRCPWPSEGEGWGGGAGRRLGVIKCSWIVGGGSWGWWERVNLWGGGAWAARLDFLNSSVTASPPPPHRPPLQAQEPPGQNLRLWALRGLWVLEPHAAYL